MARATEHQIFISHDEGHVQANDLFHRKIQSCQEIAIQASTGGFVLHDVVNAKLY